MKHAIMVIGFGNDASVLQKTISILDDKDIDFFIHWDIRYKEPILNSKKSKIIFIKNRVKAKWGSYMLIKATLNLMKDVTKHKKKYDYVHLISCNDLPLMTASYFKNYFGPWEEISHHGNFIQQSMVKTLNGIEKYYRT